MEDSLPALPVMREKEEEDWISDAKPARRRPNRKRGGRSPEQRRTKQSQTEKKPGETTLSPFKVLSPVESRSPHRDEQDPIFSQEIEENFKAG
jgi:hypothetical protein